MADNTFSHAQQPGGSGNSGWHGVKTNKVRRPLTNEEIDTNARALRARQGLDKPESETIGQCFGIPREFAQFIQRLEGRVIELEKDVAALRAAAKRLPAHLQGLETR
jgi:hypothetical protein